MNNSYNHPDYIEARHYETGRRTGIVIENGLITDIIEIHDDGEPGHDIFVAPGLVDNQVNGYRGVDFSSEGLTTRMMKETVNSIAKDGVTTFLPTIITNSHSALLSNFRSIAVTLEDESVKNVVPGFHLEGPYISPEPGFYGCHPAEFIRKPSWSEFLEYQEAALGKIIQVTIAPETEGALNFVSRCRENNITVGIGHTNASARQIQDAARLGATISTHLGNGCANLINRHLNPIWPQLASDLLTPSVIADGHHLPGEVIVVYFRVKGPDNIIITSDVNHLIGLPPGKYNFVGSEVVMTPDGVVKNPVLNCLAGASLPLKTGVGNMMRFTGCSLGQAINMASRNPARINNLNDRGTLSPGMRADLILFRHDDFKINILQTRVRGEIVYSSDEISGL